MRFSSDGNLVGLAPVSWFILITKYEEPQGNENGFGCTQDDTEALW